MLPERLQIPDLQTSQDADADREAAIVLVAAAILLLLFNYWGKPGFYNSSGLIDWAADVIGGPLVDHPGVGGYVWWGISSLVLRVLMPLLVIVFLLKRPPVEFGFRLRGIACLLYTSDAADDYFWG